MESIVLTSPGRCGSHWLGWMLRDALRLWKFQLNPSLTDTWEEVMREIRTHQCLNPFDNIYIQHMPISHLITIARNLVPGLYDRGDDGKVTLQKTWVIVLVRDPRDVAISAAYYCLRNDADIDQIRISWNMPDIPVDSEAECLAYFKKNGSNSVWWDNYTVWGLGISHILVRYEDLLWAPHVELGRVFSELGQFVSQETIEKVVLERRFTHFSNGIRYQLQHIIFFIFNRQ